MKTNRLTYNIGITFIVILMLVSLVQAFAISSPYMENKQLQSYPGETRDLQFVLQNGGGTNTITAKVELLEGSGVAEITDPKDIYTIPVGQKSDVNLKVSIPQNAKIGDKYSVRLGFSTITGAAAGQFNFGSRIEQNFDVVVGTKPLPSVTAQVISNQNKINSTIFYIAIGIIVVVVIFFIVRRKKEENYYKELYTYRKGKRK